MAIRRLAAAAAVVAAIGAFPAAAAAAPGVNDAYGDGLQFFDPGPPGFFPAYCNPTEAHLYVTGAIRPDGSGTTLFVNAVDWWDYYGIPFGSERFSVPTVYGRNPFDVWGETGWPVPRADMPPGRYGLHVVLKGNPTLGGTLWWARYAVTSLSVTTRIQPGLDGNCQPTATGATAAAAPRRAALRKPSPRVLARRVRTLRSHFREWFARKPAARR